LPLRHRWGAIEQIVETYYSLALPSSTRLIFDYQFIANPAYNTDRGPVTIFCRAVSHRVLSLPIGCRTLATTGLIRTHPSAPPSRQRGC